MYFTGTLDALKAVEPNGDCDELDGTLADLAEWVKEAIERHGSKARFAVEAEDENGDDVHPIYTIIRAAKPEEVAAERMRREKAEVTSKERRRKEFEELKKEFGEG